MAIELNGSLCHTFSAAADLSSYQFRFVKLSADNTVNLCTGITDVPIGVLQNKPSAAGAAAVVMLMGVSKVKVNGVISYGGKIGVESTNGRADAIAAGTDTTVYIAGTALETSANANEIISAAICCLNSGRAA